MHSGLLIAYPALRSPEGPPNAPFQLLAKVLLCPYTYLKMSRRIHKVGAVVFTVTSLAAAAFGIYSAIHSPLFIVQVVEVADLSEGSPVDAQAITDLANVAVGKVNLFELDLVAVEKRILVNPWVKEVRLTKRFPQTLAIGVTFREPHALLQSPGGGMAYVDADGQVFGRVNLLTSANLPVLSGFVARGSSPAAEDVRKRLQDAVRIIDGWESSGLPPVSQVSTISWDVERGYRAFVYYELRPEGGLPRSGSASPDGSSAATALARARTLVDFGPEIELSLDAQFNHLTSVFQYLSQHALEVSQIFADSGKKIVVRTSHGS